MARKWVAQASKAKQRWVSSLLSPRPWWLDRVNKRTISCKVCMDYVQSRFKGACLTVLQSNILWFIPRSNIQKYESEGRVVGQFCSILGLFPASFCALTWVQSKGNPGITWDGSGVVKWLRVTLLLFNQRSSALAILTKKHLSILAKLRTSSCFCPLSCSKDPEHDSPIFHPLSLTGNWSPLPQGKRISFSPLPLK